MHIIILIWKKATIAWRGQGGLVTKIHQQYLGCWISCKCTMTLEFLHGLGLISILFVDTKLLIPLWLLPTWYTSTQSENETSLVQSCSKHCGMLPGLMSGTLGSAVSHLLADCDFQQHLWEAHYAGESEICSTVQEQSFWKYAWINILYDWKLQVLQ